METKGQDAKREKPVRRYREEESSRLERPVDPGLEGAMPPQVFSTDDAGGDPYNHTGRFKRMFR